jgi:hypothetical protein
MKKRFSPAFLCSLVLCSAITWNVFAQPTMPGIVHQQYTTPIADPDSIPKFINALPVLKALGIRWDAVANPNFSIRMAECQQDLLGTGHLTTLFGYGVGNLPVTHPGATIVAEKNIPVTHLDQSVRVQRIDP